jgi:hypothetical protein
MPTSDREPFVPGASAGDSAVLIFAKAPVPGQVKTRLIPVLGVEGAAQLAERLIAWCVDTAVAATVGPAELWCAPDATYATLLAMAAHHGIRLASQEDGDLGERMAHAVADALGRYPHVLLIGTDSPSLEAADLRQAAAWLAEGQDAVLGPVEDGGYWLIGLTRQQPALFEGITWSTGDVMAATRERLRALGLRWAELPARWDVNRPEDLTRLRVDPRLTPLQAGT